MPRGRSDTTELGTCLITGAAGYLGRSLVRELLRRGQRVRGLDLDPIPNAADGVETVVGDVRSIEDVRRACEGVDTIFHTAAVIDMLSFASRERRERSHAINVGGTENVLRAARECGAQRLVYTSSNNVTFSGPVIDGDESSPYAENAKDMYTQTKILGEKAALAADGDGGLRTCAIRPGGIFGPGEQHFLPMLVEQCARGRFLAIIGDGEAKTDNTYIDNLVDAHIEAARHLVAGSPVCGQAYFITDARPVNYFEFFRPLVEGMGFRSPTRRIPARLVYGLAFVWELLYRALPIPAPAMTRLEVRKLDISHYSRIDKAKRDFGWEPKVSYDEVIERCLAYCKQLLAQRETVDRPAWYWWVAIPLGLTVLGVLTLSPGAHALWSASVTGWTPRWLLAGVFVWGILLHVYKGMKAVRLAEQAGFHRTSMAWGWQTFLLGFASLGLLEKRIARMGAETSVRGASSERSSPASA